MRNRPRVIHLNAVKKIQKLCNDINHMWCEGMTDEMIKYHMQYMNKMKNNGDWKHFKEWDTYIFYNQDHYYVYAITRKYWEKYREDHITQCQGIADYFESSRIIVHHDTLDY